jgi:hypothetical protein
LPPKNQTPPPSDEELRLRRERFENKTNSATGTPKIKNK